MNYAVEINVTQAKKAGATGNLYLIEGRDETFISSEKENPNAIKCDITTREGKNKNRIGYLEVSGLGITAVGFDPRPNLQHQWEQRGNRWYRK